MIIDQSADGTVKVDKDGPVGRIVFDNQARRNAITLAGWSSLADLAAALDDDEEIRVIVVSGAGTKAFISGSDISEFDSMRSEAEAIRHYNATADGSLARLAALRKPLIAVIRGYCLGGGVAVALCCDIRIAAEDAVFGVPAARIGLAYRYPGIAQFIAAVGPAYTNEIFMTARRYDAQEALQMRLVNRVVTVDDLEPTIADYCTRITENAPLTIEAVKASVRELTKPAGDLDIAMLERLADRCFESADYAEGRAAFKSKRRPHFHGR